MPTVTLAAHNQIRTMVPVILGLIPQEERPNTGLFMTIDIRMSHYGRKTREEFYDRSFCHLLFRAPYSVHGGINTFFYESSGFMNPSYQKDVPWDSFENISNHDSCWVDAVDSELTKIYFRMARGIQAQNDATINRKKVAPCDMFQLSTISDVCRVNLKLEHAYDPRRCGSRYKIAAVNSAKSLYY